MSGIAERAADSVLGSLLAFYRPELVTVIQARGVAPSDFGDGTRRNIIYRAVLRLHRDGAHVDALTVEEFLARHGCLERAGGPVFLAQCIEAAVPSAVREHAGIVARDGRRTRRARVLEALMLANERDAADDEIAELYAQLGRDVPVPESPRLHIVKGAA